jgi:hypothetical protein
MAVKISRLLAPGGAAILIVFPRIEWPGSTTKPEVEDWLG